MPLLRRIREQFPQAEELAFERIFAERKLFDTRRHKPLFETRLVIAALYIAQRSARRAGLALSLSKDEEKLLASIFKVLCWFFSIILLQLLLPDLYDYWQ